MKKKIFILDDTCRSKFGGTSLTLNALAESLQDYEVVMLETGKLTMNDVNRSTIDDLWVIGNTLDLTSSVRPLWTILQLRNFVKIEFDYGFCQYRCEQAFKNITGLDKWEPFGEKGSKILANLYDLTHRFAKKIFYMSQGQMGLHNKMLDGFPVDKTKQCVLGHCFLIKDLYDMISNATNQPPSKTVAVIGGEDIASRKLNGFEDSLAYVKNEKAEFKIIANPSHKMLSGFSGLVFLPKRECPYERFVTEAKLMGLDLILNENCQHVSEEWFSLENDQLANYLLGRVDFFKELCGL